MCKELQQPINHKNYLWDEWLIGQVLWHSTVPKYCQEEAYGEHGAIHQRTQRSRSNCYFSTCMIFAASEPWWVWDYYKDERQLQQQEALCYNVAWCLSNYQKRTRLYSGQWRMLFLLSKTLLWTSQEASAGVVRCLVPYFKQWMSMQTQLLPGMAMDMDMCP